MKYYKKYESPVELLVLVADDSALLEIHFCIQFNESVFSEKYQKNNDHPILVETERQLDGYFRGKRISFEIPVKLSGTDFQKKVWNELRKIPFGTTISYQGIAKKVGGKNKARAVGLANKKNPIPIIIPCHRVISKDGSLGGFSGSVPIKRYLIELEKIVLDSRKKKNGLEI